MRKYFIIAVSLLLCLNLLAQTKWTLRQCIDYATQNNIEIKQQMLQVESSKIDLNSSKNNRLPNLGANLAHQYSFGRSTGADNVIQNMNSSNSSFNISSNTTIFDGLKTMNDIKVKNLNLLADTQGVEKAKQNLEIQVTSYFLEVLFKTEIVKVYADQLELSKKQVDRTESLVNAGKSPKSQLFDIKSQLASDELNLTTAKNDLDLSLLNLFQTLNLSQTKNFQIEEPKDDDESVMANNMASILPPDQIYKNAIAIKPRVKEAEYRLESSKKMMNVAKAGYYPTLNLNMGYGNNIYHNFKLPNASMHDQLKNNGSEYIGLSLSIPIFDRFATRNQVRSAQINISNYQLNLENVKLGLYKEIQQAYQSAVAAQAKYESTTKAFEAANESFKYAQERYSVGKSSVFEYNDAQTKLLSSKSGQLQAKYEFLFRTKILDFYNGKEVDIK